MNTFWLLAYITAAGWVVYTYAGYPWLLHRQLKKRRPDQTESLSLIHISEPTRPY